ncbi:hypothetical protein DOY81_008158 [Sarcophaga bullata]|nr:hypothetical protein DOY81_008158 [Sarcophaga bullata]
MRTVVVLCLVAIAAAQYEYTPQAGSVGDNSGVGVGDYSSSGGNDGAVGSSSGPTDNSAPIDSIEFEKEFYTFSAPEGDFHDGNAAEKISHALKRNLRVVFIKGPEQTGIENAALQLAKSAADQRTAIYVLSKQADISDLTNKLSALSKNKDNKPEVHFVKYRTPADAENAQRTIQAQYDSLPGTSSTSNSDNAPVLDFSSKTRTSSAGSPGSSGSAAAAPNNGYIPPQSSYLPPSRRF